MVKFKKPKKKIKKLRPKGKILSAAELAANLKEEDIGKDLGSRRRPRIDETDLNAPSGSKKADVTEWMDIDDVPGNFNNLINKFTCNAIDFFLIDVKTSVLEGLKVEPDDTTLELALRKARRIKQRENLTTLLPVTSLIKDEPKEEPSAHDSGNIILNSTAEFCRTLGDIPTYGRSGNRDEEKDLVVSFWKFN